MRIGLAIVGAVVAIVLVRLCTKHPRLGFAVCFLSFIPAPLYPTPEFSWLFYSFACLDLAVLGGWLLRWFRHSAPFRMDGGPDRIGFSLSLWLALCGLGLPLSIVFNDGAIGDRLFFFVKGVVPFVYLLVYFVVRSLPFSMREYKRILDYLLTIAFAFAIVTFAIYIVTQARVTWAYAPLQFPFVVLGANVTFVRSLTTKSTRASLGWGSLTAVLSFAALLTFTKALMIVLAGSLALDSLLLMRAGSRRSAGRLLRFAVALVALAACAIVFASQDARANFADLVTARLNDATSTETRFSEWESALQQFEESPIVGKGVGYQLERDVGGGDTLTSGYVHNQIAYASMTMGIAGLFVFGMLVYHWLVLAFDSHRYLTPQTANTLIALHGCVFTLIAYGEMFATFRTIQHNFVLAVLLAMIVRMSPRGVVVASSREPFAQVRGNLAAL